jgi:alpha-L-glutamate ligase-like protein
MNRRNARYITPGNPRRFYRLVDEKLRTKRIAHNAGVPCPQTYGVVATYGEIGRVLAHVVKRHETFVIKPNRGAAGRGVLVLERAEEHAWRKPSGACLSFNDLRYHITSVLSGLYSLSELPDEALIEQRIFPHPFFENIIWGGTPDVRIVLYQTVPVLAMIRLPTRRSDGRANLHQGAVGLGVGVTTGVTCSAVLRSVPVARHPDTNEPLLGLHVPAWSDVIASARLLARDIPLNYIGVDLMLDAVHGPMMIEANARPGLAIQVANQIGLRPRLEFLQHLFDRGVDRDQAWQELQHRIADGSV